jgi:hypothetical protein
MYEILCEGHGRECQMLLSSGREISGVITQVFSTSVKLKGYYTKKDKTESFTLYVDIQAIDVLRFI